VAESVAEEVVPVATVNWRPKPLKSDGELFGKRLMPLRKAVPYPIRVRGATAKSVGEHCDACEQHLERRDSAWAHPPARRAIERVFT